MEIWLIDYLSSRSTCFAFFEKGNPFQVDLHAFDDFVKKSLATLPISGSKILCIDEFGFLEKESTTLQSKCLLFEKISIPVLLVIQKRIIHFYKPFFHFPCWTLYDLDEMSREKISREIIKNVKSFYHE
jgi:nucleoside-triphosphatase THEP1